MAQLTKRVQVLLTPEQFKRLKREAQSRKKSVGELMREAALEKCGAASREEKKAALEVIKSLNLPVSDWPQMEEEIIRAYLRGGK